MTSINLPYLTQSGGNPLHLEASMTRAKFNELTRDLVERTAVPVQNALKDAGISAGELGMVLLVGGSTRIPAVQEKVRALTGKEPSKGINPDECVAQGAAIQAENLTNGSTAMTGGSGGILLLDVTPLSLSIETVGGVATKLVDRNSTLPVHYSKVFTTAAPFQTSVEINVLQGERPMAKDNKSIGKFRLNGIKRAMAGVPQIEVTFDIDANGILKVAAKDMGSGKEQSITISGNEKMSDEEIQQAIRDAEQYASQDAVRKESIEVCNEAGQLLNQTEYALNAVAKQIDKAEKKRVKSDCDALRKLVGKAKPEKITESEIAQLRAAMDTLKSSSAHVMDLFAQSGGNG